MLLGNKKADSHPQMANPLYLNLSSPHSKYFYVKFDRVEFIPKSMSLNHMFIFDCWVSINFLVKYDIAVFILGYLFKLYIVTASNDMIASSLFFLI